MPKNRTALAAIAIAAAAALLAGCSGGGEPASTEPGAAESTTVRVALVPATVTMQVILADERGIFEENGLEVEVTQSPNLGTFAPALGSQYDFIYGTPADIIMAAESGFDLTVVSAAYEASSENSQVQIIAGKDSGIDSVEDLAGKRIASPTLAGTLSASLYGELLDAGVSPDDVTVVEVPFPNMLDQLNGGQVDAVLAVHPFVGGILAAGHVPLADPFLSVADPTIAGMWAADTGWAEANPEVVEAFRTSLAEAGEWAAANDAEARTIIGDALSLPPAVAENVLLPAWTVEIQPADLEPWIELLQKTGQLEGDGPDPNEFVAGQ